MGVLDAEPIPDLNPHRLRTSSQGRFERFHIDRHASPYRAWQMKLPLRAIDVVVIELDASEMASRTALLLHPMRGSQSALAARISVRALRHDLVEQATAV